MPKEGEKVKILCGNKKGEIGEVIGNIPMSQVQDLSNGKEISMEGARILWVIEFKDGKQDILETSTFEVISPE